VQDYLAAINGGVNLIEYLDGGAKVTALDKSIGAELQKGLVLCFCGESRASAINNWQVYKRYFDRESAMVKALEQIGLLSERAAKAAMSGQLAQMMNLSQKEWQVRKSMWPGVETERTTALDQAVRQVGASFTRVCGAGGGGMMAVWFDGNGDPETAERIKAAVVDVGGTPYGCQLSVPGVHMSSTNA
jgi:D-glycero-alpha-D-manno-heptose-7-phosphate kinase